MIRELEQIIRKWARENNELNIKVLTVHLYQYLEKEKEKAVMGFVGWANSEEELLDERCFISHECVESYLQSIKEKNDTQN